MGAWGLQGRVRDFDVEVHVSGMRRPVSISSMACTDTRPAAEALVLGLVSRVVDTGRLEHEAQELADVLAAKPSAAVRLGKAAFQAALEAPLPAALDRGDAGTAVPARRERGRRRGDRCLPGEATAPLERQLTRDRPRLAPGPASCGHAGTQRCHIGAPGGRHRRRRESGGHLHWMP